MQNTEKQGRGRARNKDCGCGSGRKFKKCCGAPWKAPAGPRSAAGIATAGREESAKALLVSGYESRYIWAYLKTGVYITDKTQHLHLPKDVQLWRNSLEEYAALPEAEQQQFADRQGISHDNNKTTV